MNMRLIELFSRDATALNVKAKDKDAVISKLVDLQFTHGNITDKEAYKKAIYAREEEYSTYVGNGIVVPHAKNSVVTAPSLAVVRLTDPIQYNADDDGESNLFFMIAAPMNGNLHVDMLARMMSLLADEDFVDQLNAAKTEEEFLDLLDKAEQKEFGSESFTEEEVAAPQTGYRILCVTACPTGIAHTYMAAENLQKAGAAMGLPIKVETNGSGGAKNVLTAEEIAKCDGIIVAADKNVEMARFDGKPVVITRVADGIHKPEELINRIVNKEAPIYHAQGGAQAAASTGSSGGSEIYKHLMNGVSHMLPFVVGGGIMIALAFLLDDYTIDPSNFGMNTPVAAFFKTAGNAAFGFILPILAAFIAMSIADRPGLAVGFAGGVLAMNGTSFTGLAAGETTGVSGGFLAALLAGFVAGYLVKFLMKITEKMPKAMDGIRPMLIYPLGGIFIMGLFMCAVNPIMGAINTGISMLLNSMGGTSKILLGCVLGGMMSVDMGGPINKAAYVFGNAALTMGEYDVMAAVMVGGMVPPIAIALSTTFFPKKWTESERNNGFVNYVMGLCFISEGAIPYAASDPARVLPSCIVGSAVAGALSMAFGCTLQAPHGGIFVFPTVGNPLMYIVALVVGSVVGGLILSALKKTKTDEERIGK